MIGIIAPMVLNGNWFEAYVGEVLVPELKLGDVVIMDHRPATSVPQPAR